MAPDPLRSYVMRFDHDVIIVGAGLAGLAAARRCAQVGLRPLVLEAAPDVGGRLTTDHVEGFLLDRGFQVLLDSYPEAQAVLDFDRLHLGRFAPGARIWRGDGFGRVADPWRSPVAGVRSLTSGVFSLADAWRMLHLRAEAIARLDDATMGADDQSTAHALHARGFSPNAVARFFRPFFGGVFLDDHLAPPEQWFMFLFGMFATGNATLPAGGMQEIPRQLATGLPAGTIRTNAPVAHVREHAVELRSGECLTARAIIMAADARQAADLVPGGRVPTWVGCATLYYAAEHSPVVDPLLVLNGAHRRGPINHVCVPSDIAAGYAPPDQALVSATALGVPHATDEQLDRDTRAQLSQWFGATVVRGWRLLRVTRVPYSLPQGIPASDTRDASVRLAPGLYAAGDYLETPSINGALRSGRRAADAVWADLSRSP